MTSRLVRIMTKLDGLSASRLATIEKMIDEKLISLEVFDKMLKVKYRKEAAEVRRKYVDPL